MKYYVEKSLSQFDFWGNAEDFVLGLTDNELDAIEAYLETGDREYSETEINDLFSFEQDFIHEILGHDKCEIIPEKDGFVIYVNDEREEDGKVYHTWAEANEYANENYVWII